MARLSLEIITDNDKVRISLPNDRASDAASTSNGVAFIPDWNDRHFTRTADKSTGAPLHRITDETRDEQITRVEYGSEDKHLFEMHSTYGAFGQLKPVN